MMYGTGLTFALSETDLQLLAQVARGYSNTEIAEHTGKAVQTVNNAIGALCKTLKLRNRTELAVFAIGTKLVDVDQAWDDVRGRIKERAYADAPYMVEV
jgi:DNA-binding CsgD family transcriptional regulator